MNISEVYKLAHAAHFFWFHLVQKILNNLDGELTARLFSSRCDTQLFNHPTIIQFMSAAIKGLEYVSMVKERSILKMISSHQS